MKRSYRLILIVAVMLTTDCLATDVRIPMKMGHGFIESLAREQVFAGPGNTVRINDAGTGCQYLELRRPRISADGGMVRLRTDAEARAGRPVGDRCLLVLDWRGQLEFDQRPVVSADRQSVLLRTVSWRALRPDGQTDTVSTTVGRWLEQFLPVDLKQTRISLVGPIGQLRAFLALALDKDDAARNDVLLDSVAVDAVDANDDRVVVTLALTAPQTTAEPRLAEPELSDSELAQLESRLGDVDAFITYTIKHLITDPAATDEADALFEILLELRYELVAVISDRQRRDHDPARALFVNAWDRLTGVLEKIAEDQTDYDSAMRYLTFIGAGDMLHALDRLGPGAGIDISSDGLRRLARILIPRDIGDPLHRDDTVDPDLRRSFGLGEPLPPPQDTAATSWLNWFVRPAFAAGALDTSVVKKLNSWVPGTKDMDVYLPMVRNVLRYAVAEELRASELARSFRHVFRHLLLAAAWQESCWRQFTAEKRMRVPLQSRSGDVGLMQINQRVWRGFYDQHGLKWDIAYNARAGADILENYMVKYAVRNGEHKKSGKLENLARSAYAAYNGGPRQYDRYRRRDASAHGKKVDALFYEKLRAINGGNELAVKACYNGSR